MPLTTPPALSGVHSASMHMVLRILIGSYFIAMATAVIPYEPGHAFARMVLPDSIASYGFTIFLFATSFLILIGHQVRGAVLLLALFLFWSSYFANFGPQSAGPDIAAFWADLALIGGLMMAYALPPGTQNRRKLRLGRKIVPRRVRVMQSKKRRDQRRRHVASLQSHKKGHKTALETENPPDQNAEGGPTEEDNVINIFAKDSNVA